MCVCVIYVYAVRYPDALYYRSLRFSSAPARADNRFRNTFYGKTRAAARYVDEACCTRVYIILKYLHIRVYRRLSISLYLVNVYFHFRFLPDNNPLLRVSVCVCVCFQLVCGKMICTKEKKKTIFALKHLYTLYSM